MGSCAAPSAKGDDKFITTDYLQQCHVISKRYTQRIERHNLNLRQHLARLGRKSLSFSKSVELHDKVIGHYLNIKHYQ
ncbi:hypothetical protein BON82_05395 [Escherichia coli]|nr:hypothetical protein BON82_05395 [Escherichia coli]